MRRTPRCRTTPNCGAPTGRPPKAFSPPHENCLTSNPMPQVPIIMPQLGESIAEASVISLLLQPGAQVEADQDVLEVETNKATMNVTAPCRGKIEKFLVKLNESYSVGSVLEIGRA